MSKQLVIGFALGFLIAYAMRMERVQSGVTFPTAPGPVDTGNDAGLFYLYNYGLI